jgi:hypothetical protein
MVVWLMASPLVVAFVGRWAVLSIAGEESMERAMHGTQPDQAIAPMQKVMIRAALALIVIACGLSLRWYGFPLGLPAFVVKYGGSLLWATMVFLLAGVLLPRLTRTQIAALTAIIAIAVEFSRLVHAPWLDAFRLTTAGALLLGRIFSLWNLAAYAVGIAFGVWIDCFVGMRGLVGWAERLVRRSSKSEGESVPTTSRWWARR